MSDILISKVPGRIPTVNQLMTTKLGIGWNKADGKLYGLKEVDGSRTVVQIGGAAAQDHNRLHSMTSTADHSASAEADRDKFMHSNADTGEPEWVTLTIPAQLWKRVGTLLSPLNDGDSAQAAYLIADNSVKAGTAGNDYSVLLKHGLNIIQKALAPSILSQRYGDVVGSITQAQDLLLNIAVLGYDGSTFQQGATIEVKAGNANFSATNRGSSIHLKTVRNGTTALKFRIDITSDGNVVINEDGEATDLRVEGDTDQNLLLVKGNVDRVGVGVGGSVDAKLHIKTKSTEGTEAIKIEQLDDDQPFTQFVGTSAANLTKNITTYNGAGAVVGPRGQAATEDYFQYAGMVKQSVNGEELWMPLYRKVSGT